MKRTTTSPTVTRRVFTAAVSFNIGLTGVPTATVSLDHYPRRGEASKNGVDAFVQ